MKIIAATQNNLTWFTNFDFCIQHCTCGRYCYSV